MTAMHPTDQGYAHPELLVEPAWLQEHLDDPGVRVIDCDVAPMYQRAHIPGAVGIPAGVHHYLKEPAEEGREYGLHVMSPERFESLMADMGVSDDTLVVTYDSSRSLYAARVWWVLNYHGHTKVAVLNGGWDRWVHEGRPVSLASAKARVGAFHSHPKTNLVCTLEDAVARVGSESTLFWDVRTDGEWTGAETRGNRRAGRIPGAVHLEWSNLMTTDANRVFRPAAEMRSILEGAGITPEREVVTY